MTVITEGKYISDVLHWEEEQRYSREVVVLATKQHIEIGSVLAKHGQTGKYHAFNPEGKDGLEVPIAISITFATTQQFDAEILVIKREAVLKKSGVVWPEKITEKQQQSAVDHLDGLGLLIRE
jgi:hypothetical protein